MPIPLPIRDSNIRWAYWIFLSVEKNEYLPFENTNKNIENPTMDSQGWQG